MDWIKFLVGGLAGALGGVGLYKRFGEKEEDRLVLKVWSGAPHASNVLFEVPFRKEGDKGWVGATPDSGDAWSIERVTKEKFVEIQAELLRKKAEEDVRLKEEQAKAAAEAETEEEEVEVEAGVAD